MNNDVYKWPEITEETIRDEESNKIFRDKYRRAKMTQEQRTRHHEMFSRISHMQNLYDRKEDIFSEGSTQAIKRKLRQQTIQRVPDGELVTQYDKNSIEQVEIEYIFNNKVLTSEYDGKNMLKNLMRTFNNSYDYGYGAVRTGFEKDADGDIRISYKQIQWNNILPAPDCDFIEEAEWYIERDYLSRSFLESLLDWETEGEPIKDKTFDENVVKYILDHKIKDASQIDSVPLADRRNSVLPFESIETWTLYKRGWHEFKTFVPAVSAVIRTVPNYDPRKDVPIHFMILEPDPEFPLGCSSVMWTMAQQQFADAFQTVAYDELLLAVNPPLMGYGYTTPPKIAMMPRSFWPMGTNPNNKIEKFPIETTTLSQYGSILQNVSANMMRNMNAADGTVASDAKVAHYSGTPQGVQAQQQDKTITVNQYQKQVEIFFAEWANHALRSYLNAMGGTQDLTVDEETRRRVFDIEKAQADTDPMTGEPIITDGIIHEDKISIDFDKLSADMLEFKVRAGSLIQSMKEEERKNIQELLVPISQMLPAVSDENKKPFETNIMELVQRLCELSNITLSDTTANNIDQQLLLDAQRATMEMVMQQQQQIQAIASALMPPSGEQPVEGQGQEVPGGPAAVPPEGVSAEFPPEAGGGPMNVNPM